MAKSLNRIVDLGAQIALKKQELTALEEELREEIRKHTETFYIPERRGDAEKMTPLSQETIATVTDAVIAGKVVPLLDSQPHRVFSVDDLVEELGLPRKELVMSIGRMIRWNKIVKVGEGQYKSSTTRKVVDG